jgi:hypothetical protein
MRRSLCTWTSSMCARPRADSPLALYVDMEYVPTVEDRLQGDGAATPKRSITEMFDVAALVRV